MELHEAEIEAKKIVYIKNLTIFNVPADDSFLRSAVNQHFNLIIQLHTLSTLKDPKDFKGPNDLKDFKDLKGIKGS